MPIAPSGQQFAFPLADRPNYDAADFMVSSCNDVAFTTIHRWPDWAAPFLFLSGPEASGKTHLAHIWAARSHARFLSAPQLDATQTGLLIGNGEAAGAWVVETLEKLAPEQETTLFHLINAVREQGGSLLMTANLPAAQLAIRLPDLSSRMLAAPAVALAAPDETVLKATLIKQFADRQLRVSDEVLSYLLPRMERSYQAARHWVKALDEAALAEQRKLSIPLVRRLLEDELAQKEPPLL